jgi:aminopeptidase N
MKYIPIAFLLFVNVVTSQQIQFVDFKSANALLTIDPEKREVSGTISYSLDVLKIVDTISIDAQNMDFTDVKVNGKPVKSHNSGKQLQLISKFKKGKKEISFNYSAHPKQTMYFIGSGTNTQIWTQGQGKYTSHWFPSFDDVNEKVVFNVSTTFSTGFTVISNGKLKEVKGNGPNSTWHYTMDNPMSSYLLMIAIGKFDKSTQIAASGTPLEFYIEPEDALKLEPTYRYSKQIFDFLEKEIGVAYPWENYKQIPVRDFLYAGMENTSATIFARDFVVDSVGFNDRNYVNVNAHELAHQWFGDLVTAKSGTHHWLQEGFATYYALLAEKDVFGADYFYSKLYDMAENLQRASKSDTIPVMNEKASSLTFYQKGAWALHVLRENVGHENFRKAVKSYLLKYQFTNVETDDFLKEINKVSSYDTQAFKMRWLETGGFEIAEAISMLKVSPFMNNYFAVADRASEPYESKHADFEKLMQSDVNSEIKEELLFQTQQVPFAEKLQLVKLAMATGNVKVRQMVAKTLTDFPAEFADEFETLLNDKSYVTQEIALNVLWSQFPEKRVAVLDKTSNAIGMNDKNLWILWLTLALATKDFQTINKSAYYDELLNYASANYEGSVRMNAIENLLYIDKNDSNVLQHLVNATVHHKWQVTQFARGKIRELLKNPNHRTYFSELMPKLSESEKVQLEKLLKE